jgi:hypothetical protein
MVTAGVSIDSGGAAEDATSAGVDTAGDEVMPPIAGGDHLERVPGAAGEFHMAGRREAPAAPMARPTPQRRTVADRMAARNTSNLGTAGCPTSGRMPPLRDYEPKVKSPTSREGREKWGTRLYS